jgi:hypothetical protein
MSSLSGAASLKKTALMPKIFRMLNFRPTHTDLRGKAWLLVSPQRLSHRYPLAPVMLMLSSGMWPGLSESSFVLMGCFFTCEPLPCLFRYGLGCLTCVLSGSTLLCFRSQCHLGSHMSFLSDLPSAALDPGISAFLCDTFYSWMYLLLF